MSLAKRVELLEQRIARMHDLLMDTAACTIHRHAVEMETTPIRRALRIVADHYSVEIDKVIGPSRAGHLVEPRLMVYWVAHTVLGIHKQVIADNLARDVSSVKHGIRSVKNRIETDPVFANAASRIAKDVALKARPA